MKLTDTAIRNSKPREKPYRLSDGNALYLVVTPSGAKRFEFRYRFDEKQQTMGLGTYPIVRLSEARLGRDEAKKLLAAGIDPLRHRRDSRRRKSLERSTTFGGVAQEWMRNKQDRWSETYAAQVKGTLENDVLPQIGTVPIRDVSAHDLLQILQAVESRGAKIVAINIRQWCSGIFRYAIQTLRADADPAAALRGVITRDKVRHQPHLTKRELPAFIGKLERFSGDEKTEIALWLLLQTFVRTSELRKASWNEFDLEAAEWHIPAARMKMREQHVVPLSSQSVKLLDQLHQLTGKQSLLFPNRRRPTQCMCITTINRAIERMGFLGRLSGHGIRGTASTILYEEGYSPQVIERQLAHKERNSVVAAYNHAQYLGERRKMLQWWANYLDSMKSTNKVVDLRKAQVR